MRAQGFENAGVFVVRIFRQVKILLFAHFPEAARALESGYSVLHAPINPHSDAVGRKNSMNYSSKIRLAATLCLAFAALGPAQAAEKHLTILMSVPGLEFP